MFQLFWIPYYLQVQILRIGIFQIILVGISFCYMKTAFQILFIQKAGTDAVNMYMLLFTACIHKNNTQVLRISA